MPIPLIAAGVIGFGVAVAGGAFGAIIGKIVKDTKLLKKFGWGRRGRNVDSNTDRRPQDEYDLEPMDDRVIWLKEGKYVVSFRDDQSLNKRRTVHEGRAIQPGDQFRKVAVKIIRKSDRTKQELAVLQKLEHDNIVKCIDFDEIETKGLGPYLFIIFELCECNMTTFMEQRKDRCLSIKTFNLISNQLLGGLEYLHRNGLIHRDIKPDNILVIQGNTFKYSNFGITKEIPVGSREVTQTRGGIGSDGYRAPETYADDNVRISYAADIFSLAIVMAQLISKGKHPYGARRHFWKTNIILGEKLDLSHVDIEIPVKRGQLIDLLTHMLSKIPGNRPLVVDIRNHEFFLNHALGDDTNIVVKEFMWLKGKKYKVFLHDDKALNPQLNVRQGQECQPEGQFRKVAVKIIKKTGPAQKELAVMKKLKHKNIVKFLDFDEIETNGSGPHLYLIMELCKCSLTKFMEKRNDRSLSIRTFNIISKQLIDGLEYIHRNGYIHRDIKPDNILVTENVIFKYSDFGITKEIPKRSAEVTQTRDGIGSDGYRAPETYNDGEVRISRAVDIFSLAIVLAQLISKGKHPYGIDCNFWKTNIILGEKLDLSNVGIMIREKKDQLIDLLTQMLSNDPEKRPLIVDIRSHILGSGKADTFDKLQDLDN